MISNKKKTKIAKIALATTMLLPGLTGCVKMRETVPDFTGVDKQEVIKWAEENNISYSERRDYSEYYELDAVFHQNVPANSYLDEITSIELMVSDGKSPDKEVLLPDFIGMNEDEVLKEIKTLGLMNVKPKYEVNEDEEVGLVVAQSKTGHVRRDDALTLTFAQNSDEFTSLIFEDLVGKNQYDAISYLEKNNIKYKIVYEYNNEQRKGTVASQSLPAGSTLENPESEIKVVICKGKFVELPDLSSKPREEISAWGYKNGVAITYSYEYDDIITVEYAITIDGDSTISEDGGVYIGRKIGVGESIHVELSKGPLVMEEFKNLKKFEEWAEKYSVQYKTVSEYNDNVKAGELISISKQEGDVIKKDDVLTVTISKGSKVTIPTFVGLTKSEATSLCNQKGINCSFSYGGYNSKAKDTVLTQSVSSGTVTTEGATVKLTLSKGPAKTYTVQFSASLLGSSYSATKNSLSSYFEKYYPGVTFNFTAKSHNSLNSGQIHPDSPLKPGATVTQGKTYTVYIVN